MRNRLRQQGFTLIELLVAIFLGMMVMAAGYTVFQSSNRATREQNMDNRMVDNARVAMDILTRNFRRAGFLVNFTSYPIKNGGNWPIDGVTQKVLPVNSAAAPDAVTIVGGEAAQMGVLLRSASRGAKTLFLASTRPIPDSSIIGVGLTYSGLILGTPVVAGGMTTVTLDTSVPTGALNIDYPGKFLQDGVTPNDNVQEPAPVRLLTATRYQINTANAAHPVLEHVTQLANAAGPVTEPIAEDIEDMQIAYGVDANNNRIIEAGEWIMQPTAAQVNRIRMVRVTIVARTAQPDPVLRGVVALAQTVPFIEDRPARANLTDGYRRYILTRIIKTRNLDAVFTL